MVGSRVEGLVGLRVYGLFGSGIGGERLGGRVSGLGFKVEGLTRRVLRL